MQCISSLHASAEPTMLMPDRLATATALAARWFGAFASWVARVERIRAAIVSLPRLDPTDQWALTRVEEQSRWLADPRCEHSFEPRFRAQPIHGDYHLDNLIFRGSAVSSVIDWDNAVRMPRAYELARACFFISHMRPSETGALLTGYRSVTPIASSELEDGAFIWNRPFRPFAEEWRDAVS